MAFVYHQVFCDESGKYNDHPLIAFAGVVATPDRLRAFDDHWRDLLRDYELADLHMERVTRLVEDHGYRFRKGQTIDDRTELLIPFADCINKYLEQGLIQAWNVIAYNRIPLAGLKMLGGSRDPYFWAFIRGLLEVVDHLGEDDRISIVMDDDETTAWDCYCHYRSIGRASVEIQKKAISLSFANDKHVPALQAADMVAFLTRQEATERFYKVPNPWRQLFDRLTTEPEPPYGIMRWFSMFAGEEQIVNIANDLMSRAEQKKNKKAEGKSNKGRKKADA